MNDTVTYSNPRSLEGEMRDDPEARGARRLELTERLEQLEAEAETFASPGWVILHASLYEETNTKIGQLLSAAAPSSQVDYLRGQIEALRRIIGLPAQLQRHMDDVTRELNELNEQEREETP